jgi:hypothetical protein
MIDSLRRRFQTIEIILPFVLFLCLAGNGITEFFGGDDLSNLYIYLGHPFGHWLMGLVRFWSSAWYRPLGGIVYLALFGTFGFNPLPFKILLFIVLLLNMLLFYHVARRLGGSARIASWALLLCSYHAAFNGLYLNFGTIYDVLGYSFYFLSLLGYIRWVSCHGVARVTGLIAILLSYIAGLCCKEMVVTLPLVLFAYGALLTDRPGTERWRWPVKSGLPVLLSSAIAVIYTLGKLTGPDTLANNAQYAPHVSLNQFATISAHYMREIFHLHSHPPAPAAALWIFAGLLALACVLRSRLMIFCACSIVMTQLPVSFMAPRGAFVVYIPFAFWGLYLSALVNRALALFRRREIEFGCYFATAVVLVMVNLREKTVYDPIFTDQASAYEAFSKQLDAWNVHLSPSGRVLLINDPFPADWIGWDPLFLLNVRANTTGAIVNRMKFATYMPPVTEVDWYDYAIDYDTRWRLLKSPKTSSAAASARLEKIAETAPILMVTGFQPPAQPGWRSLNRRFALRTSANTPASRLSVSLYSSASASVSVRVDGGDAIDEKSGAPGNLDFDVPLHGGDVRLPYHTVSFTLGNASGSVSPPETLFVGATLKN